MCRGSKRGVCVEGARGCMCRGSKRGVCVEGARGVYV